jgi:two-component system, OmpR family, sensor kinase
MKSIRQRLLRSLLIGMVLIASATGVLVYRHVQEELDELYNAHLRQIALFMAREWDRVNPSQLNATPIEPVSKTVWDEEDYLIQVWTPDGVLIAEEVPAITRAQIPRYAAQGFYDQYIAGESWRIYRADGVQNIVQIAQPESARRHTINETSLDLLVPLLLQVPLLMLVAWLSVRRGLKPLDLLSRAIAQRQPETLNAIDGANQPRELQPLVATLNDLLMRLNLALQQQRNFIADAAHELRTPIAALQLQLDLLERAKTAGDQASAIAQLRNGLQRTTQMAQQLLSIARAESIASIESTGGIENIESDTGKAGPQTIDLELAIKSLVERYLPFAYARQLDLGVTRLEPANIHCLPTDIETVLDNLLGNAIRYTPRGGRVDLALYLDSSDCVQSYAVIEIIDSGIGIPADQRHRVFDRFYRVLRADISDDYIEGSGLGLAIVKTICNRYGASIDIGQASENGESSDEGEGTRCVVRWPAETAAQTHKA